MSLDLFALQRAPLISSNSLSRNRITGAGCSKSSGKGALEFLDPFLSFFSTSLVNFINPPLLPSVDPKHVLTGNFAPVDELPPTNCPVVEGELPQSLNGTYIRNGPNPPHQPRGPHHLFEGDGMLHSIRLSDGQATFCIRYVKTCKYALESNVGFPIFPNILSGFHSIGDLVRCAIAIGRAIMGQIDLTKGFVSNRLFALGESDLPYSIHLSEEGDIETIGRCDLDGKAFTNMTAHPKIDSKTGRSFCLPVQPNSSLYHLLLH